MEITCLTKIYRFSAGHRLYLEHLTEEENLKIFDTCANPKGHGHDYYLEVKVAGDVDKDTGMVVELGRLDRTVNDVLGELDYTRLDTDIPYFSHKQPTGENIIEYVWDRLENTLGENLVHLRLGETSNNFFEIFKEGGYPYEC